MIYSDFNGEKISALGFGTMRLPLVPGGGPGDIDQEKVNEMTAYAMAHGVNYFDTAYPYHASRSELSIAQALAPYPRESYYLADKFPGHQKVTKYDPEGVFADQLKKCRVDYFDFYLLHNVNENDIDVYLDPKWGIPEYFDEQRRLGKIKYLGFSCHADAENMEYFLNKCKVKFDFCQIQLNYLDWTLQNAEEKCRILAKHNIPVWVMEPLRGGRLAKLSEGQTERLKALRPDEGVPAWGFRFLQGLDNVKVILSGMSAPEQMADNVKTFEERKPLNEEETKAILAVAEEVKTAVPCTSCRYCCAGCPKQLEIPKLINLYNDVRVAKTVNQSMRLQALGESGKPENCIGCGKCKISCPQKIDIPALMKVMAEKFKELPDWDQVCREREAAQKNSKN